MSKIRNSFVSNSSSSSFIIMGESISFEEAKNYNDALWILEEWGEGNDCIELTKEVLEFLDENPNVVKIIKNNSIKLFGNYKTLCCEGDRSDELITKEDLHRDIFSFDKSYHCCGDDISDIKSRYGSDNGSD